ncbi:alpha/beta hydrolase [Tsukamurella pulmonis]|uniref:alpha/beta hydrolase n=1 Tax=Tsukamurella pulmonis TaxID=47312 RepID=UPI000B09E63A|nr:alpha/beta hydrolase [Tsukamurella pulmonis]
MGTRSTRGVVGPLRTGVAVVIAGIGTLVAFLLAAIMLGAYFPKIPKAGVIGPVLGGQYPIHIAAIGVLGAILGTVALRLRYRGWGVVIIVVTALSTVAALVIATIQLREADRFGVDVKMGEVFGELAYPDTVPDRTETYSVAGGEKLDADLYLPRGGSGGPAPAVILAHAGGFHTFDKSDLRGTGRWLADHGVATLAVDYRLASPERATWDQAPRDLATALSWARKNASRLGIDRDRISLGGMSAGGTVALNTAYRLQGRTVRAADGSIPQAPVSVIGFYPGVDVREMWSDDVAGTREAAEMYTGGRPDQVPDRYRTVSPVSDVRAGLPRTLLVTGDRDRSVQPRSITAFGDALENVGVETEVHVLPFAEHAFDDAYGSITSQTSRRILLDFLD